MRIFRICPGFLIPSVCLNFIYQTRIRLVSACEDVTLFTARRPRLLARQTGKEHNMKSNIVLIGMPGVGKSTIGVVLAKNLGYHFMDSDIVIQQQTGKLLHEIITEKGLDGFLQTEDEVNAGIDAEKTVIATGGSAVFGKHAMQHLAENGTIIYLSLPYEQIEERLGDLHKRGVALRENQTLYDIYQERIPLYEKYADLIIDCQQKSIRQIVAEIARKLGNKE